MAEITETIEKDLQLLRQGGLERELRPVTARQHGRITVKGKKYIDFSSNDYLGLSHHPLMIRASYQAMDQFGTGSGASRLLSGDLELHHQLERKTATFKGTEAALVFNSGYQANLGIISSLVGKGDCVFSDRLNHASIIDGIKLSGAKLIRFRHNSVKHLAKLLAERREKYRRALIISETVFSMDGDRAPLLELAQLKKEYGCLLMVDEAHATGIFGLTGSGEVEAAGVTEDVDLIMGTFSKGLGSFGAYCAASRVMVDYLVNTSRSFIYSTALPPAVIAASSTALDLVCKEKYRRQQLLKQAEELREALKKMGFKVRGESQIIPVIIGDNLSAVRLAKRLREKRLWLLPIREPTVPRGQVRLRISLTANHTAQDIEQLLTVLENV